MLRRMVREAIYSIAREDLARFLDEHEEELLRAFRNEIEKMDRQIPEEKCYIDVHMVPLGDAIVRAALDALRSFLKNGTGSV